MSKLNDMARDVSRLIDNAATSSQNLSLIDDEVTREAIKLNVAAPFIADLSEAEAKLARALEGLRDARDRFHAINTQVINNSFSLARCVCDQGYTEIRTLLSELENK